MGSLKAITVIGENIRIIREEIPLHVKLVAVSKTKPVDSIYQAYRAGQRAFGENRAQELAAKYPLLPSDIEWHFIGHLQTNKVKYIASIVHLIHSVDSFKLLREINSEGVRTGKIINCLLQFHIAEELSKFGLSMLEAREFLASEKFRSLQNIRITGVMGMATFTDDEEKVRNEFRNLKRIFDTLKEEFFSGLNYFSEISMGMSEDYGIAIEEGTTLVRIGSKIFGERINR